MRANAAKASNACKCYKCALMQQKRANATDIEKDTVTDNDTEKEKETAASLSQRRRAIQAQ